MAPERYPPDDPREWLRLARGDAALAHAEVPDVPRELLCFHAQQAAEKAIKAVLLAGGIPFPHTHDLDRLLGLLEQAGVPIPPTVREADSLTVYAVLTRYPLPADPVSEEEFGEALERADAAPRWAEARLAARVEPGPPPPAAP